MLQIHVDTHKLYMYIASHYNAHYIILCLSSSVQLASSAITSCATSLLSRPLDSLVSLSE